MAAPKLTDIERETVVARVAKGESKAAVARDFGVKRQSVQKVCASRLTTTATEVAQARRVNTIAHALDDKDAMVRALLEDAERLRAATLDEFVTVKTIRHRSYDKTGAVTDEWEREEPCIDWVKAKAAGALRNVKRFSNTRQGQTVELHDVSNAGDLITKAAKLRGWDVTKLEHSGEVASKVYIGQHPSELLPRADGNPDD